MNTTQSPLILIGVGGAGTETVRAALASYGAGMRAVALDSDARSGAAGDLPFVLLGGSRLAGRGAGGEASAARAAFQDNPAVLDTALDGVRTAVVATSLGGGTGGGATSELLKRLHTLGIATMVFATMPFGFEGQERARSANTAARPIEGNADVSVFLPMDDLAGGEDDMGRAMEAARATLAAGLTLLWRLVEKPGYVALDAERLRGMLSGCGRAAFAFASARGPERAQEVLAKIAENPAMARDESRRPVRSALVGVLAGDDLRLSEVAAISSGVTAAFAPGAALELGTVNDEEAFGGTLSAAVLLFEESASAPQKAPSPAKGESLMKGNSRFRNVEKTMWRDEDLDVPTYIRRNLTLDR